MSPKLFLCQLSSLHLIVVFLLVGFIFFVDWAKLAAWPSYCTDCNMFCIVFAIPLINVRAYWQTPSKIIRYNELAFIAYEMNIRKLRANENGKLEPNHNEYTKIKATRTLRRKVIDVTKYHKCESNENGNNDSSNKIKLRQYV